MNDSILFSAPTPVAKKINRLYRLLVRERGLFEQVAGHITDNALRCTILSLAQQNNQYAVELSSYMETTGSLTRKKHHAQAVPGPNTNNFPGENKVLGYCSANEKKIVVAYQKILQESVLYEGLQQMMHYQLNGILSAFVQLKLLSAVTPRLN
jgi:hypothetical protein